MHTKYFFEASRSHITSVLLLSLGLTLSACGGGGGGGSSFTGTTASSAGGAAAKGIIKNGIVTANELDATGAIVREVGTAVTDSKGEYKITISSAYAGGPIDFKLTGDTTTVMVCDIKPDCGTDLNNPVKVTFGSPMKVPGLTMEALVGKANSGDVLSVNITPFTTMAAFKVRTSASFTAANVNNANSAVSNLLGGLDILSLKPINLADSSAVTAATTRPEQITYAALSAGIGQLAMSGGNIDLNAALEKLGNSFATGSIGADTIDATKFSLKDILTATNNQLTQQSLSDGSGVTTVMQQTITSNTGTTITPTPSPNAGSPAIVKAKALVQDIRTWGVTIDALEGPANAFSDQIDMANGVMSPMINSVSGSMATAMNIMLATVANNNGQAGSYPYIGSDFGSTGSGSVSVTLGTSTATLNINGTVGTETVNLTTTVPTAQIISSMTVGLTGTTQTTATNIPGVKLTLGSDSMVTATFSPALDLSASPTTDAIVNSMSTGSFTLKATLAQINTANPVTFTGSIGASAQRVKSGSLVDFNPTKVSLSGSVSNNTNSFQTTIDATISNASTYDPFQPDSATNLLKGTLSMSMAVQLANLPKATVTITANRTGFSALQNYLGNATLILALSGGSTTTVTVTQADANPATGTLEFKNTSGAILKLTPSTNNTSGTLKVGSDTVGTATQLAGGTIKISYEDGTFETLN